jgi:hypothetical protein
MIDVFSRFLRIDVPETVACDESGMNHAFDVTFVADGAIPFPQVVLHARGKAHLIKDRSIEMSSPPQFGTRASPGSANGKSLEVIYVASVSAGLLHPGDVSVQVEGCKKADFWQAGGDDWVKAFRRLRVVGHPKPKVQPVRPRTITKPRLKLGEFDPTPKIYFGIHKHMHQPYYNTTDPSNWDGEKDEIFGSRAGPYTEFIPAAVQQYIDGGLPHAGISTSWSGSLLEQLDRCAREGLGGGRFGGWNESLRRVGGERTVLGNPRVDFTALGFFHPLMALIPGRNIVKQIEWHRRIIPETFGVETADILFPPETAFHVRMIPALKDAGIEAVIYDSIHRFRTCREYPYAGTSEGMLPPNRAEQVNPPAIDWLQLHNIWAGSKIAPSLLRPEYVEYTSPEGEVHKIIGIPAERYIGNEDARGGFGALQYPDVLAQVYDEIIAHDSFDPKHPPFFLLHSDGDNHGGGAESYYKHNTGRLVEWIKGDPRFELITVRDYLSVFPPDPGRSVHLEPGAWSGADNGDPQFMKWFSRYNEPYSPDLNSWAVLTALQNAVHSLEDAVGESPALAKVTRLMLTAETSCYWYWTGQTVWDQQVTNAANLGYEYIGTEVDSLLAAGRDRTGPTIFPPWVTPENPGGKRWGQGCLEDASREGIVHTFIYDISGLRRATLILRTAAGERSVEMTDNGPYPSRTGAAVTANYFTADLPVGAGDVRFFIEAEDDKGNGARSTLERVYLA